jgi:ubiquinone biosynthesis protein COQ9
VTKTSKTAENHGNSAQTDGFEAARQAILPEALEMAAFDGWTATMLDAAAREAGFSQNLRATVRTAFPAGVIDLIAYWSGLCDEEMRAAMAAPEFAGLKIREKVAFAVRSRIDGLRPHKEAARRAAAFLALPPHAARAAKLAWATSDAIWRGLDDKSTDFNFYSKRAILTGVWTSTFARWLADDSEDEAATHAFLDARIENVMQIEKLKAKIRKTGFDPSAPIAFLARLRYRPAREGAQADMPREGA